MSDLGPKHLSLLAKSLGLNNAVLQVAVSDLKRQLGAAQEAIRESQVGSTNLKKQLIELMGKRWNGTFASIASSSVRPQWEKTGLRFDGKVECDNVR